MTAIIITVIISMVVGVVWAHSIAETDPDEIERKCEHETKKHSRFVPLDEDDAKFLMKNGMPLFNGTCSDCGALCFDDDTYCPECGSILNEE